MNETDANRRPSPDERRKADTLADDLLAADSMLFLTTSLLSYTALRTHSARKMKQFERWADWLFISAMTLMVGICAFICYPHQHSASEVAVHWVAGSI